MFRKPMRLEKWIAFDGGFGADVFAAVQDAADPDAETADSGDAGGGSRQDGGPDDSSSPSAADNDDAADGIIAAAGGFQPFASGVSITIDLDDGLGKLTHDEEIDVGIDPSLPFWETAAEIEFIGNNGSVIDPSLATRLCFEVQGDYTFIDADYYNDIGITNAFINLPAGYNRYVFYKSSDGGDNGFYNLYFSNISGENTLGGNTVVGRVLFTETGMRFALSTASLSIQTAFNSMLKSIVHTGTNDPSVTTADFAVFVYYDTSSDLTSRDSFTDDGVFSSDNFKGSTTGAEPVPVDPVDPPDPGPGPEPGPDPDPDPEPDPDPDAGPEEPGGGNEFNPDPDPEPGPDPDPEPVVPPVTDPAPIDPGTDGDGDSGPSGESGGGDDSDTAGSGAGGDAGGQSGEAVYVIRREEIEAEEAEYTASRAAAQLAEGTASAAAAVTAEDGAETAAEAAITELLADLEAGILTMQGDRQTLEVALSLLRQEYMFHSSEIIDAIRDFLREIFSAGSQEMAAAGRILDQMRRQLAEFTAFAPERRDGMLAESIRELLDSADRHSGEAGALSEGLARLTAVLRAARLEGAAIPEEDAARAVFQQAYEQAMDRYREAASRNDPMGKEMHKYEMQNS